MIYPAGLGRYISRTMRMSSTHQPVILRALLQAGTPLTAEALAPQLELPASERGRAKQILMRWPKRTLVDIHGVLSYDRMTEEFALASELPSAEVRDALIVACNTRIIAWKASVKKSPG